MNKPILCLDFDGVIHKYSRGWQDGSIYDGITEGFVEWATEAKDFFQLVIYSSRSKTPEGIEAMKEWLAAQWADEERIGVSDFEFASEKPPSFITIDDRALTFNGDWGSYDSEQLLKFKPWNMEIK